MGLLSISAKKTWRTLSKARFCLWAALLAAVCFCFRLNAAGPHGTDDGWAINNDGSPILTSSRCAQISAGGTGWVRIEFRLVNGFSTWNNTMLGYYDTVVNNARAAGLQVIALIDYTSWPGNQTAWCANSFEQTGGTGSNAFITNFVNGAVVPIVQRFKDRVQVFELWNEPSTWSRDVSDPANGIFAGETFVYPSNFSWLLNRAWTAVHKTQGITNVTLISGGVFGTSTNVVAELDHYGNAGAKYIDDVYRAGTNAAVGSFLQTWTNYGVYPIDGIGQHIYVDYNKLTTSNFFRVYLDLLRSAYTKYEGMNTSKKTFVTEFGWTSKYVSQSTQDANLRRAYQAIIGTPYVQTGIWFRWEDQPESDLLFGVLTNGTPKLAYQGYQLYQHYEGKLSNGTTNNNIRAYFESRGQAGLGNPYDRGSGNWVYNFGAGLAQDFNGGSHLKLAIISSTNGTFEISNLRGFWDYYLAWEGVTNFGLPTVNEFPFSGGWRQNFERGYLTWDGANGIRWTGPIVAPNGLAAYVGNARINLNWNAAPGASGYKVKRSTTNGGPYAAIADVSNTNYADTFFVPGTTYFYVVSGTNSFSESGDSNQASASPTNGLADVIVTSIAWTPTNLLAGTNVVFRATIRNIGSAPSPSGIVHGVGFAVDGGGPSYTWSDTFTGPLAIGASRTLTANSSSTGNNYWTATLGTHSVTAIVDDINRFSESVETNNSMSATFTVYVRGYSVNCGGSATGTFSADGNFNGSATTFSVTNAIDSASVTNAAPQGVYQSERSGSVTYTFPDLNPTKTYKVRLHFAEISPSVNGAGQRMFDASINGKLLLDDFDILAVAGAKFRAVLREFYISPDPSEQIVVAFTTGTSGQPKCGGIEVLEASALLAPRVSSITASDAQVELSWNTYPGKSYRVEYKDDLNQSAWTAGGEFVATSSVLTTSNNFISNQRYFRIVQVD